MAYSSRFKALKARTTALRNQFLPQQFSAIGTYTPAELDNARAYRVLIHAELEHFFEERALELANVAFDLWRTKSKVTLPLVCLLSNSGKERLGLPTKLGTSVTALSITGAIVAHYRNIVGANHGVRISNLLGILLPVGIMESDIDTAWLATTDGFGAKRGVAAHTAAITYTIDPQDDYSTVNQIMMGVKDMDALFNNLRRKIR